jgi:hypothetical protein
MKSTIVDTRRMLKDNSAEQTGSAASTPVGESSPLSELPGTPQVNDDATIDGASTANGEDEAATGDDDDASEQSLNQVFRCEYCGKAYNNEKSLKVCTVHCLPR